MTTTEVKAIADRHLDLWFADVDKNERGSLREHVEAAITEALDAQHAANCRAGVGPNTLNNPPFVRHCGPQHDQQ